MRFCLKFGLLLLVCLCTLCQEGCVSKTAAAPISSAVFKPGLDPGYYKVHSGDTLYSIAWAYNLDYRKLAQYNGLSNNTMLQQNEIIRLTDKVKRVQPTRLKRHAALFYSKLSKRNKNKTKYNRHLKLTTPRKWQWPTSGKVVKGFSSSPSGNKGLNITGKYGQPIVASAQGVVVYCGTGVRGYGKLIIIKHDRDFLTAYANNSVILVKLGQKIKAGQAIARMGNNNAGLAMLHFEIRYDGKPLNPRKYLI